METQNQHVVSGLEKLLADSYVVYLKTHGYHWNVTGQMFTTLHTLFEQQYMELADAVDEVAERIRALGVRAPGSYPQFLELETVAEDGSVPVAEDTIRSLVFDSSIVVSSARQLVRAAEGAGDDASGDLGIRRIEIHEKAAWMLRSRPCRERTQSI